MQGLFQHGAHHSSAYGLDSSSSTPFAFASCATCRGRRAVRMQVRHHSGHGPSMQAGHKRPGLLYLAALCRTSPSIILRWTDERQHDGCKRPEVSRGQSKRL